jgi:AcrR family transcriptional regulator
MTAVMTPKVHSPRESTVRSAALLFRERGVAGTGLRDVVEHAGAPRGSLQHYFPGGKRELLAEAMAWMAERAARPLRVAAAAVVPPPPSEVVGGLLDRFRELLTITGFRGGCPIVAAVADASWDSPAVADAAREAFAVWLAPLEEALVRGGLAPDRATRVALLVVSAAEGALVVSRARRDFSAFDAVQAELELLLRTSDAADGHADVASTPAQG